MVMPVPADAAHAIVLYSHRPPSLVRQRTADGPHRTIFGPEYARLQYPRRQSRVRHGQITVLREPHGRLAMPQQERVTCKGAHDRHDPGDGVELGIVRSAAGHGSFSLAEVVEESLDAAVAPRARDGKIGLRRVGRDGPRTVRAGGSERRLETIDEGGESVVARKPDRSSPPAVLFAPSASRHGIRVEPRDMSRHLHHLIAVAAHPPDGHGVEGIANEERGIFVPSRLVQRIVEGSAIVVPMGRLRGGVAYGGAHEGGGCAATAAAGRCVLGHRRGCGCGIPTGDSRCHHVSIGVPGIVVGERTMTIICRTQRRVASVGAKCANAPEE
mmetsp:Transcript_10600/g.26106  ORF Transcript_10600/g.26106 Transcript_10600/m.26106 type:complete len:328 (-) Transcript_10600:155-1138(-)